VIEVSGASERSCTLDDLTAADEAFLASTTREVQPIGQIDDFRLDGGGAVSAGVAAAVSERVRSELAASA
jgi:branched-chain amino acid aminotransferase